MVAVSDTTTAVYIPVPEPRVDIVDETGAVIASTVVTAPPSPDATMSRAGDLITWWTGDSVMVFSANNLQYKYTVAAAGGNVPVGPATIMAGRLMVPVSSGYDVFDPATRAGDRHIAVQRPATDHAAGPVVPAVAGSPLLDSAATSWSRSVRPSDVGVKVASALPLFQCLSSAPASSRYATAPLFLRPASTDEPTRWPRRTARCAGSAAPAPEGRSGQRRRAARHGCGWYASRTAWATRPTERGRRW